MSRRYPRYRFRPKAPPAVVRVQTIVAKRASKCASCGLAFTAGECVTKLSIRKQYRHACATCKRPPVGSRKYHTACQPLDPVVAMGVQHIAAAVQAGHLGGIAPPVITVNAPKPKTAKDLAIEAMAKLEDALVAQLKTTEPTPDQEKAFGLYQKLKESVVLGRTNVNEDKLALRNAIVNAVKLVF